MILLCLSLMLRRSALAQAMFLLGIACGIQLAKPCGIQLAKIGKVETVISKLGQRRDGGMYDVRANR